MLPPLSVFATIYPRRKDFATQKICGEYSRQRIAKLIKSAVILTRMRPCKADSTDPSVRAAARTEGSVLSALHGRIRVRITALLISFAILCREYSPQIFCVAKSLRRGYIVAKTLNGGSKFRLAFLSAQLFLNFTVVK